MRKLLHLLERDLIFCSRNIRVYAATVFCLIIDIFVVLRVEPAYVEYAIILSNTWVFSTFLLDLLVYKDILRGRTPHVLAYGYKMPGIILEKSLFTVLYTVFISLVYITIFRLGQYFFHYSYPSISIWMYLVILPFLFMITSASVYLLYRFHLSRPIKIVLIAFLLLFNEFKEMVVTFINSDYTLPAILAFLLMGDAVLIWFIKGVKNEDII